MNAEFLNAHLEHLLIRMIPSIDARRTLRIALKARAGEITRVLEFELELHRGLVLELERVNSELCERLEAREREIKDLEHAVERALNPLL